MSYSFYDTPVMYIRYDFQNFQRYGKMWFFKVVGDSCVPGTSSCIMLAECKKDIKPHLSFNIIDSTLKGEMQLILARAGTIPNYAYHQMYLYLILT